MKKLTIISLILLILLSAPILANLTSDVNVTLGNEGQEAGVVQAQFRITNTGNETLSNFTLSTTASGVYAIQFSGIPENLTVGQSALITVTGTIPLSFHAVTPECVPSAFSLGTISITTNTSSAQTNLFMQRANHLVFQDVDIEFNGCSESFDEGDTIDLELDSDITLIAEIENDFDDDGFDIEDITLFIESDELDINEDVDVDDLRADRDVIEEISFDIDFDEDDDTYPVSVFVCGTDENQARHGSRINASFEIEREDDFVIIRSLDHPQQASCGQQVTLRVGIENIGEDNQDDVTVQVLNDKLRINEEVSGIEVEEDDTENVRFTLSLPSQVEEGLSYFEVSVLADDGRITDTHTGSIQISCGEEPSVPQTTSQQPPQRNVAQPAVVQQPTLVLGDNRIYATTSSSQSFRTSGFYIPFLILLILVAIVAILIMARVLPKKQSSPETQKKRRSPPN